MFLLLGILKVYENLKFGKAFDYAAFAWDRMEACCGLESETPKDTFEEAAFYLDDCDQKHVNVAVLWQRDEITIHFRLPNSVRDIFYRLEKDYEFPLRARKICVLPFLTHGHHSMMQLKITPKMFEENKYTAKWWLTKTFFLESPCHSMCSPDQTEI